MIGRLVHKADFERLLATRSRSRSAHFALHHVACGDLPAASPAPTAALHELSTEPANLRVEPVDDLHPSLWFGTLVPKRHARRAVTRSLLKRQMRVAFGRHAPGLPAGHWLVRLRVGFPVSEFISARSAALAEAARTELDGLLSRAGR